MEELSDVTEDVDRDLTSCPKESHGNQGHDPAEGHLQTRSKSIMMLARFETAKKHTGGSWS
jgi:hypothetical protein